MKKNILFLLFFTCARLSFGQIRVFPEIINEIPRAYSDGKFVDTLENIYNSLISEQSDSIFLLYTYIEGYNFATIFWKKNGLTNSSAVYQINPKKGSEIKVEILNNRVFNSINIRSVYAIMQDSFVRMIDTLVYLTHDDPAYTYFFFDKRLSLYAGFSRMIFGRIGLEFWNAHIKEEIRIKQREKKE